MNRLLGASCWVPFFSVGLFISFGVLLLAADRSLRIQALQSVLLSAVVLVFLVASGFLGGLVSVAAFLAAALLSEVSRDASKVAELLHIATPVVVGGAFVVLVLATVLGRLWAGVAVLIGGDPRLPWVGARAERLLTPEA